MRQNALGVLLVLFLATTALAGCLEAGAGDGGGGPAAGDREQGNDDGLPDEDPAPEGDENEAQDDRDVPGEDGFDGQPVEWREIARDHGSQAEGNRTVVVDNADDWQALWLEHTGNESAEAPEVDFAAERVVAFFSDYKTPCEPVRVDGVYTIDGEIIVDLVHREPGPAESCIMLATIQYAFVTVPAGEESVRLEERMQPAEEWDADAESGN